MTKELFEDIVNWQENTFPLSSAISKITHLAGDEPQGEILELKLDILEGRPEEAKTEFADCFILLMGAANSFGLTYDDVCKAIQQKMEINKARKWGAPDENGVCLHIKDEEYVISK